MRKIGAFLIGVVIVLIAAVVWIKYSRERSTTVAENPSWPLQWDLSPTKIEQDCKAARENTIEQVNRLAKTPLNQANWGSLLALERALAESSFATSRLSFYSSVHPDKAHRDAALACSKANGKLYVDFFTRSDLYRVIEKAAEQAPANVPEQRLAEDYLRSFKSNGLHLAESKRKELKDIRKEMIDLTSEYRERLNNWKDPLKVDRIQVAGLPDSFIKNLEREDEKYLITLAYPHYYPFMELAEDSQTRKALQKKFFQRGGQRNKEILQTVLSLRLRAAKLLGYRNHAEAVLEERMAETPAKVRDFLQTLINKLKPGTKKEYDAMVAAKRQETSNGDITNIEPWDWRYFAEKIKKNEFALDQEKLAEYFPLNRVLSGMLDTYETLFNVKFIEVVNAPKWHPSVKAYAVHTGDNPEPRAYFYMDLYPREGKYGHAAAFTLVSGRELPNGTYQKPVSAIVANFTPPTGERPSLLKHSEVETLFHEFGHIVHQTMTTAKFDSQSGTSVERDFVEAPSQMLENWVWEPESLHKLSSHFKTEQPIPDDLMARLLASRHANASLFYSRQAFLASVDLAYHTVEADKSVDTTKVWSDLQEEIMLVGIQHDTYPEASFGHVISGYDAGYYGYLWSKVYAQDMYSRFAGDRLFDTDVGTEYLKVILEPGGSFEPAAIIAKFLGRKPNESAFLKSLGLENDVH